MSVFSLRLTTASPSGAWHQDSLVSYDQDGAFIHVKAGDLCLRQIQKAARQIDSNTISEIALNGDWDIEQQWAFAVSFVSYKGQTVLNFVDNEDKSLLEKRLSALVFTRQMVNHTPEVMSPEYLATNAANWLTELAPNAVSYEIVRGEELEQQGWTGIYNVGRGSVRPPVMLILDYNPSGDPSAPVDAALVGKGITFDSGGYSIKSSEGMLDMKCDMGGAATVTGALGLAIMEGLNKRVKLFLCCAENLISGHAYKLGDFLTYKNGLTVEIVNTDAEGRLVLADGLIAASETNVFFTQSFILPAVGPITGVYGSQRVFNGEPRRPHFGVDVAGPVGTPVVAPADGVVRLYVADMYYSGGTLIIDHGHQVTSTFIHLHKSHVKAGDRVKQGQLIAEIGDTGRVTGAHLDWRINWGKVRVDPQLLVPALD